MKRFALQKVLSTFVLLLMIVSLVGCIGPIQLIASGASDASSDSSKQMESDSGKSDGSAESKRQSIKGSSASFLVPEGWVKSAYHSTNSKYFYVEEGHEDDKSPDNISIEIGKNRYSADEHDPFREAIVRQLTMQMQGLDATLTGDGTYTDQGYVVYAFTISEPKMVTKQFYIVGDKQYCLIHLTNFTGSESADEAAQFMVDSFEWE